MCKADTIIEGRQYNSDTIHIHHLMPPGGLRFTLPSLGRPGRRRRRPRPPPPRLNSSVNQATSSRMKSEKRRADKVSGLCIGWRIYSSSVAVQGRCEHCGWRNVASGIIMSPRLAMYLGSCVVSIQFQLNQLSGDRHVWAGGI